MKRAHAFFMAGSAGLVLAGLLHMLGQLKGGAPADPQLQAVEASMRSYLFSGLGMQFTVMDVMQCWGIYFGLLAIFAGAQGLLVAGTAAARPALLQRLAFVHMLGVAVLIGVAVYFRIAPPMIVFSIVFGFFTASWVLSLLRGAGR